METIIQHIIEATCFAAAARVWRFAWHHLRAWLRDFAIVDVTENRHPGAGR